MIKKPKCSVCPDDISSTPKDLKKYQTGTPAGTRVYSDPKEYEVAAEKYRDSLDLYTYNNNRLQKLLKQNKQAGATNKLVYPPDISKSEYESAHAYKSAQTVPIDGSKKYKKQGEDFESLEHPDIDPIGFWKLTELYDKYNAPSFIKKMGLQNAAFSIYGKNLALWTPDENPYVDPELSTFGSGLLSEQGEFGANPTQRTYGASIKLTF